MCHPVAFFAAGGFYFFRIGSLGLMNRPISIDEVLSLPDKRETTPDDNLMIVAGQLIVLASIKCQGM